MSVTAAAVSPQTTLVILLGASEFPLSPNLESTSAFANSADHLRQYFVDEEGFNVPAPNIFSRFDSSDAPTKILGDIADFLTARQQDTKAAGGVRDLLLYYTGHGGFTPAREYFLAIRSTLQRLESGSSLRMADLAATLKERARNVRRFLILDCCFSAAAFKEFQAAPLAAARVQTMDSMPREGTTLLCSSNARTVSIAPPGAKYTMFSGALLEVLRRGVPKIEVSLSMEQVGAYVKELISEQYPDDAVRPEVLSPDQRSDDIALLPVFPNAATRPRRLKDQIEAVSAQVNRLTTDVDGLAKRVGELASELRAQPLLAARVAALETQPASAEDDAESPRANPVELLRRARLAGRVWVVTTAMLVSLSFYSVAMGGLFAFPRRYDPVHWIPIALFAIIYASKIPIVRQFGWIVSPFRRGPPTREDLDEAVTNTRLYRLFGTVFVSSPYFEIASLLYLIQALVFTLAVVAL